MNTFYHIKQLRKSLANRDGNNYENYLLTLRDDLRREIYDDEDITVLSLLDLTVEFLNPVQRFIVQVGERLREEEVIAIGDWCQLPAAHIPLTIRELFISLTDRVSQTFSHFLLDHLNATSVQKSDLIEAIDNGDYESFEALIRSGNIDYEGCCRAMAYVTAEQVSKETVQNGMAELFDEDYDDDEEYYHQLCLNTDYMAEHLTEFLRREGVDEVDIASRVEVFTQFYDEINRCYRDGDFCQGLIIENYLYFVNFIDQLRSYYADGRLLDTDIDIITHFAARKRDEFPAVRAYFDCYTTGEFLSEDFQVVDSCDFDCMSDYLSRWFREHPYTPAAEPRQTFALPVELDIITPAGSAGDIFRRAIQAGFIAVLADGTLTWQSSPSLLDYFCGVLYCGDYVDFRNNEYIWSRRGALRLPKIQLNALFGNRYKIGDYRKHQIDRKTPPQNYSSIHSLLSNK